MMSCLAVYTRVARPREADASLHVLYVRESESKPLLPFSPLVQYFLETGAEERPPWQREVVRAVGLLLDYLAWRGRSGEGAGAPSSEGASVASAAGASEAVGFDPGIDRMPTDVLRAFVETLLAGTQHLREPERRGLNWPPCAAPRASRLLFLLNGFCDWLCNRTGRPVVNAWRTATAAERCMAMRWQDRRSANALVKTASRRLRHEAATRGRSVRVRPYGDPPGPVKAFDAKLFPRLLLHGFRRRAPWGAALARRFRLRDMLIAILQHGGGLRISEAFHLWVGDVGVDPDNPDSALVYLYHPSKGAPPRSEGAQYKSRKDCLQHRYRMGPRHRAEGRLHAGWKRLALCEPRLHRARVHWFAPFWGELFLTLFNAYCSVRTKAPHPFLFVSENKKHRGDPYTLAAYEQAHACAVRRIGLVPAKDRGTTPHGHRHAYGRALKRAGVDRLIVMRAMHHRSPDSQDVYTEADISEVSRTLCEASARIAAAVPTELEEVLR